MRQLLASILLVLATSVGRAATISVADYGAVGDLVVTTCNTTSGSTNASIALTLAPGDVGKLLLVFGAGPATSGGNHQDFIGTILSVSGTNCTLSSAPGNSLTAAYCQLGTQNASAFQNAISALATTNDTVNIPSGNYLLVSPFMLTNGVMSNYADLHGAISLSRGGITFRGIGTPTLAACGAWKMAGSYAHRGAIILTPGPVTNNYPLVFDNLIFDGGLTNGSMNNHAFPASTVDGTGWDVTHTAFMNIAPAPVHTNLLFSNCSFQHWRGEMIKSGATDTNAFVTVTNCVFSDGNASAFNLAMSHDIVSCLFSLVFMSMEFNQGYASRPSFFRNSVVTNTSNGLTIAGALTNNPITLYTISNNVINGTNFGISLSPGNNLLIVGNTITATEGIGASSAGIQGNAPNANWLVVDNVFTNILNCLVNGADATVPLTNALFLRNTAYAPQIFATGYGYSYGVHFASNVMVGGTYGLDSRTELGEMFIDDLNNTFPAFQNDDGGGHTNSISYNRGGFQTAYTVYTNSVFQMDDVTTLIPNGATMVITNISGKTVLLQMSSKTFQPSRNISSGGLVKIYWDNGIWKDSTISYFGEVAAGTIRNHP